MFCTLLAKTKNSLADHNLPKELYNHSKLFFAEVDLVLENASKNSVAHSVHCLVSVSIIAN